MTLYELTQGFQELWEMIDDPEVDDDVIMDTLEGVDGEIEDKADGYAKVIANANALAAGIKAEEARLAARRKSIENRIQRMKQSLKTAMEVTGKTKFKTDLFSFSVAKNGGKAPLIISEEYLTAPEKLPLGFQKVKVEPNTDMIRERLDAGDTLEFAKYGERGTSLRIK